MTDNKPFKTLDDLGVDASKHYGFSSAEFDDAYITKSKIVAQGAQYDISLPISDEEIRKLLVTHTRGKPLAAIGIPDRYNEQRQRLFKYQLAPHMGPEELLDVLINRIEAITSPLESDNSSDMTDQEGKVLIDLLETINFLNTITGDVNAALSGQKKG